jgi:choline-sulfatase/uncharacterized sulfatase
MLCALAGLEPLETSDGKDLSPLQCGEHVELHRIGLTEFAWSKSVRKGRYRYVCYLPEMFPDDYPNGSFGELYDLEADPWEMQNLYFDPEYADVVRGLQADLLDWLVATTRAKTILPACRFGGEQATTRYGNTANRDGRFQPDWIRRVRSRNYI